MNSPIDLDGAISAAEDMLRKRNEGGTTRSEVDFIAGASAIMEYVWGNGKETVAPPIWIINGFTGRPILKDCPPPEDENRNTLIRLAKWLAKISDEGRETVQIDFVAHALDRCGIDVDEYRREED